MRPGDVIPLTIWRQTAAGAPSTGKLLADFSIDTYLAGVVTSFVKTITELASTSDGLWRGYKLNLTLDATAGMTAVKIGPASGTDVVYPDAFQGEIEAADLDSIAANTAVAVTVTAATGSPTVDTPLVVDAYRYHDCSATRYNTAGVALDLTGYTNPRFAVWDRTHSISLYSSGTGITLGGAAGTISWPIPENASFHSQIDAAIALGQDTVQLYYDIVADKAGDATKTVSLLRGTLTLRRFEAAP